MSGRTLFAIYKPFINLLSTLFGLLPRPLGDLVYEMSTAFSNNAALLIRYCWLKARAASAGDNVYIGRHVVVKNVSSLCLGSNVSIHDSCYIDAMGGISIGDNVSIAHSSSILSFDHQWCDKNVPIKYNPVSLQSVSIGNDVWIGCGTRILAGVTISARVVVGAGSIVNKSVSSCVLVAGCPAKFIKNI